MSTSKADLEAIAALAKAADDDLFERQSEAAHRRIMACLDAPSDARGLMVDLALWDFANDVRTAYAIRLAHDKGARP